MPLPLNSFCIKYRDDSDPGCPVFTTHVRAYDAEGARERFLDAPDGEGWEIIEITQNKCKGCGEPWPCSTRNNRGMYSGIEAAKHHC